MDRVGRGVCNYMHNYLCRPSWVMPCTHFRYAGLCVQLGICQFICTLCLRFIVPGSASRRLLGHECISFIYHAKRSPSTSGASRLLADTQTLWGACIWFHLTVESKLWQHHVPAGFRGFPASFQHRYLPTNQASGHLCVWCVAITSPAVTW